MAETFLKESEMELWLESATGPGHSEDGINDGDGHRFIHCCQSPKQSRW
jgi:hypothetical protein